MAARDMGNDASSGTLTFVFTDLQSSTRLWETFPDAMKDAMERHDSCLELDQEVEPRETGDDRDGGTPWIRSPAQKRWKTPGPASD